MRLTVSFGLIAALALPSAALARPHHGQQIAVASVTDTMLPSERMERGYQLPVQISKPIKGYRTHRASRHPSDDTGSLKPTISFAGGSIVAIAKSQIGNGPIYGRRSLWCATFMNWVLAKAGYRGTGSDLASSFAHLGHRIAGPQVGAIAVMSRGRGGGHVGVVVEIADNGNPIIVSGNHGARVDTGEYPRGRIYAYVVP